MLNELPCLKWKSPLGVLTVPHFVNIWLLLNSVLLSFTMWHSSCSFPHSWSLRAPAFLPCQNLQDCPSISLHLPAMQLFIWRFYKLCSLTSLCPYNPPSQKMILAPLTTSLMAESDPEHLEEPLAKGDGETKVGDGLRSCGRSEGLPWRWRKPLQSWICEIHWEIVGSWGKGFHNLPREEKPEGCISSHSLDGRSVSVL